jgi:N-acetyl-anhydromuramyl-L-alanine amidase AmpD
MAGKPPLVWHPADESNYSAANRWAGGIDMIVIHVTQGAWSSAINWFKTPNSEASAHYVIRSEDGEIAQCVSDQNIAWHAGNWSVNKVSIGIEHEGFIDDPKWFTDQLYDSSARLVAYLCIRYGIPINRQHVIGHDEVPGCPGEGGGVDCHTDPGQWWWWDHYMRLVRQYARG